MAQRTVVLWLIVGMALWTVLGCAGISDPGYAVAIRNESDVPVVVRGDRYAGVDDDGHWLLRPQSAGIVLSTTGLPREALPIDYAIIDEASCRILGVQHVDFALAPNPGFSEFIITVRGDFSLGLETRTTGDPDVSGSLETTIACAP